MEGEQIIETKKGVMWEKYTGKYPDIKIEKKPACIVQVKMDEQKFGTKLIDK